MKGLKGELLPTGNSFVLHCGVSSVAPYQSGHFLKPSLMIFELLLKDSGGLCSLFLGVVRYVPKQSVPEIRV